MRLLTLDTETGGLDPASDALLTVGLIASEESGKDSIILGKTHIEVQPEVYLVWDEALAINKINLENHKRTALSRKNAAAAIVSFITEMFGGHTPTVLGHNTSFDLGFLGELFNCTDHKVPYKYRSLDTAGNAIFMRQLGIETGDNLPSLIKFFGIEFDESTLHNALVDATLTYEVYLAQIKMMRGLLA